MPRATIGRSLAIGTDALAAAQAIAHELIAFDHADGSLRGSSAAWLVARELQLDVPPPTLVRWEEAALAAIEQLPATFFDGMLGAAWMLAVAKRAPETLAAVDDAVLDALGARWDGGLASFGGGLAGFGIYGLARLATRSGRRIVERCVAQLAALAARDRRAIRWSPHRDVRLVNREGSAAAVAFLGAASRARIASARALASRGAATLAADFARPVAGVGVAAVDARPGLVHGSGTWALGSAGAVSALLAVDVDTAARVGRALADVDPAACDASDASFGSGTAGIACTLHALWEATAQPVFAFAAEHWYLRTLRARRPRKRGEGIAGYLHVDPLASADDGGGRWAARPGLLDGAAGTALALACAARGTRRSPWFARLVLA